MIGPVALSWVALVVAWLGSFLLLRARRLDASFLFLLLYGVLIVFRSTVLSLGLDTPFPDEHFLFDNETEQALIRLNLVAVLWLVGVALGNWVARTSPLPTPPLPFRSGRTMSLERHRQVLIVLNVACVVVAGLVLVRSGGLGGAISAQKFERVAGSTLRLRSLGIVTSSLAVALVLRHRFPDLERPDAPPTRPTFSMTGIAGLFIGAFTAFVWGARDGAAFPVVAGVLFWSINARPANHGSSAARWRRLALGGGAVAALVVGLRVARDVLAKGTVEASIEGESLVRQTSVAANLTQFDAALLAVRDWPKEVDFGGFTRLFSGLINYLPGWLGGPAERVPNAASELASRYEPTRTNGWPLTAVGEWWIASGKIGVLVGGIICGVIVNLLGRAYRRPAIDPLQLMMLVLTTVVVFQFGLRGVTFSRIVTILVPLLIIDLAVNRRLPSTTTSPARTPVGRGVR